MFAYEWRDSFLCRLNPLSKLLVILFITVIISLSLSVWPPLLTLLAAFVMGLVGGKIPPGALLKKMRVLLTVMLSFTVFMLIFKGIGNPGNDYSFAFLSWGRKDFLTILSLGLRIGTFAFLSILFVLTTSPNDLVLSLILQLHLSPVHGYAALAAYRFVPTVSSEIRTIRMAQEIRGVEWEHGLRNRIRAPFYLFMPLLCTAARRGERVAAAMENRGLGVGGGRTYFKTTAIHRADVLFAAGTVVLYVLLILFLAGRHSFLFSLGFQFN